MPGDKAAGKQGDRLDLGAGEGLWEGPANDKL